MGKKNRKTNTTGKMTLPGKAGAVKERYCLEHMERCKPVRVFKQRGMMWECAQGCRLRPAYTILK